MIYSLSPAQKQIVLNRKEGDRRSSNQLVVHFAELLGKSEMLEAFLAVVNEHDLLKSILLKDEQLRFPQWKLQEEVDRDLLSVTLNVIQTADQETVIELSGDELCTDLTSLVVILRAVLDRHRGVSPAEDVETLSFQSYSSWHNDMVQSPPPEVEEVLAGYLGPWEKQSLNFQADPTRLHSKGFLHQKLSLPVSELKQIASSFNVEPSTILFTVLNIMAAQYQGSETSVADFSFNRRDVREIENTVGPISQNVPVSINTGADQKWSEVLMRLHNKLNDLYAVKESYPLTEENFSSVGFESIEVQPDMLAENGIRDIIGIGAFAKVYDLKLTSVICGDTIRLNFSVADSKCTLESLEAVVARYQSILKQCLENTDATISEICIVDNAELELIEQLGNNKIHKLQDVSVLDIFLKWSTGPTGKLVALRLPGKELSFEMVHDLSGRLADFFIKVHQIVPGDRIALVVGNNDWIPVAILAILKAGACFVPIDPGVPAARLNAILADSGSRVILVDSDKHLEHFSLSAIDLNLITLGNFDPLTIVQRTSNSLAYIIYTSGSTGTPKGVAIEDRSLVNYASWFINEFKIKNYDASILLTSYSFDLSFSSIWGCLLSGGALTILPEDQIRNHNQLLGALIANRITFLKLTPSFLSLILNYPDKQKLKDVFRSIRLIVLGGEAINTEDLQKLWDLNKSIQVVDEYGPTETTVGSIAKSFSVASQPHSRRSIVGRPINNTTAHICDHSDHPCPIGVVGEICIGGYGVARGLVNDPGSTNNKFRNLPGAPGFVYKTGDRGRLLANGEIEFLGRVDSQIKINGYRIEIEEVNDAIRSLAFVNDVRTLVHLTSDNSKQLASFVTSDKVISNASLLAQLKLILPLYMIPSSLMQVRYIPLTANGKLDEKELLSQLKIRSSEVSQREPVGVTEIRLLEIFRRSLLNDQFGVLSDFFLYGGDSIRAIRMMNSINSEFEVDLQVKDLYSTRTVEALCPLVTSSIQNRHRIDMASIAARIKIEETEISQNPAYRKLLPDRWHRIVPISDVEQGMIYHTLIEPGTNIYVDETLIETDYPEFDVRDFSLIVTSLVNKHDNLRTSFHLTGFGRPVKIVHNFTHADHVDLIDLSGETEDKYEKLQLKLAEYRSQIEDGFDKPFGIWKIAVFRLSPDKHAIGWIRHHSIIDGWSAASFLTELCNGYVDLKKRGRFQLGAIKATYVDYLVEQEYYNSQPELKDFWLNYLSGFEKLRMPLNRHPNPSRKMVRETFTLPIELASAVIHLSHTLSIPPKTIFLAAYIHLLSHSTNTADVTLGVVSTARPEVEDGDKILGCFLHRLPFRVKIDPNLTCGEFIKSIHNQYNELAPYNKVSLSSIVKALQLKSQQIYEIAFDYMDFHIMNEMNPLLDKNASTMDSLVINEVTETLFDLSVHKTQSSFLISMNYLVDTYSREDITNLMNYMISTIEKYHINTQSKCFDRSNILAGYNESYPYIDMHEPLIVRASVPLVAARNEVDKKLISIWAEVLKIAEDQIGINHNFFDHGGHSLAAINLLSRITNDFSISISIVAVFEFKDLTEMSDYIYQQLDQVKKINDSPLEFSRS